MLQIYEKLVNNSLAAALSSIEIYNKPDFKYREEIFTILNINAWELLLKAKILKDANNDVTSLYVIEKGSIKQNRSKMPLTIDIMNAIKIVNLDPIVVENLNKLIDIRDTAVHFYQSDVLSYLLYTLGVASLRNYQKLIASWFSKSLLDYNFYILPLGFVYNFKTLSMLELEKGPEIVANLIKSVTETQASVKSSGDFDFVCEVSIEMKTAKHFVAGADLTAAIDQTAKDAVIVHRVVNLVDKYPLSYTELCAKVKKELSSAKQNAINRLIREHDIKKNPSMSHYVYKSKTQEEEYKKTGILPKGTPSIYNEDAVRYIVATLSTN